MAKKDGLLKMCITILISILLLVICFNKNFILGIKVFTEGEELGYYNTIDEFNLLYSSLSGDNSSSFDFIRTISGDIQYKTKWIKESKINEETNKNLITNQLITKYYLYKITIDDSKIIYLSTKEFADDYKETYQSKWKDTKIDIEQVESYTLDLLSTEEEINDLTSSVQRRYNTASRSGINVKRLRAKLNTENLTYILPLDNIYISSEYGMRTLFGVTKMHTGIDFGTDIGSSVYACTSGVVTYSDWYGNYGYYIKIKYNDEIEIAYAHLSSLLCKVGDTIEQGQVIALSGSTGRSTGPHLHVEFIVNGEYKNPRDYLIIQGG